jgi:release factor glutamine methyltransferase
MMQAKQKVLSDTRREASVKIDLALDPELIFSEGNWLWNSILEQLKLEIPIQYLLGSTSFYGLNFEVNESTDSETRDRRTGGLDYSKYEERSWEYEVESIRYWNGIMWWWIDRQTVINQVDVTFIEQNILETADLNQQFDIIVSNPPYVRNLEKQEIKKNVLDNEPHLALFVEDDDALIFYKNSSISTENLLGNGQLYFEINQYLGKTWSLCLKS